MLTTIKGYYDRGQIVLEEAPPVKTKTEVMVTFLTEETKANEPAKYYIPVTRKPVIRKTKIYDGLMFILFKKFVYNKHNCRPDAPIKFIYK
jgi:hypothetical protein